MLACSDPSQAPPGHHTIKIIGMQPYDLKEGPQHWDDIKHDVAQANLNWLRKFSPASTPIELNMNSEHACWRIAIADRGRGMPRQQIRDVGAFKQFWNSSETPARFGNRFGPRSNSCSVTRRRSAD